MLQTVLNILKNFLKFLVPKLKAQALQFFRSTKGIPFRYLLSDFASVLRSVGFFFFLQMFGFVLFTMVPQGKDILLIIAEDLTDGKFGNMLWLLVGIIFWSITAEFASRYAIYVTDNSAKSLSDNRVRYRQALQKAFAAMFLLFPFITIFIGLTIIYLQNIGTNIIGAAWGYYLIVILLYFIFSAITRFYFDTRKRKNIRENRESSALYKLLILPERELKWCNKLYGIYNDYVFALPKPENFKGRPEKEMKDFADFVVGDTITTKYSFPQSDEYIIPERRVPQQFRLIKFTDETGHPEGQYRWIYLIPVTFYNALHRQLRTIFFVSLFIFLIICFLPISMYPGIGAPALVVISFACWSGFYVGVLYVDYAKWRNFFLSLRFLLLALFLITSVINDDHPVRCYGSNDGNISKERPDLKTHFASWLANYETDSVQHLFTLSSDSSQRFYPVVFVCAEGGALRTGGFTATMLSRIQDEMKKDTLYKGFDFNKCIYAFSGVSGGSLGVSFFNAVTNLTAPSALVSDSFPQMAETFFSEDHLSPLLGKMFYGDLINLFIPVHIHVFDRAEALERSWEYGFDQVLKKNEKNVFESDDLSAYNGLKNYPALFINTTEVETGYQCWLTNVKPDSGMHYFEKRDLLNYKLHDNIHYSTMINFSTRFPLFSPAAMVQTGEEKKMHYVDGGYVENTGCATMLEILRTLYRSDDSVLAKVKPFVIILRISGDSNKQENLSLFNEITEIGAGIYNTRSARTETAVDDLKKFVQSDKINGVVTELKLEKTGNQVPMNWVLSKKSMDSIKADVDFKWKNRHSVNDSLRNLFFIDTDTYRRVYDVKK